MRRIAFLALMFSPLAAAAQSSVPFSTDGHGAIAVKAQVGMAGAFHFLVDTGSSRSVVTVSAAQRMDAPVVAKTEVVSSAGSEWRKVVRVGDVKVGAAQSPILMAAVVPDDALRASGIRIDGILGQDFLRDRTYLIDYERKMLVWNPARSSRGTTLRLVAREGRYLVSLPQQLDGSEVMLFVPDSGSDAVVLFENGGTRLLTRPRGSPTQLVALGGRRSVREVTIPRLRIGAEVVSMQRAVVVARENAGADGLLTLSLFRRVLIDGQRELMTVWR